MQNDKDIAAMRRKRINRMKKIIVIFLLFLILMPTFLCIVLFVRLNRVQKQLNTLMIARNTQQQLAQLESSRMETETTIAEFFDVLETPFESVAPVGEYETQLLNEEILLTDEELVQNALAEGRKVVYLTFDDGPSEITEDILEVLDKYGVKATFFTIGNVNSDLFYLYNEIIEKGHTLGMHSYSHVYSSIYANIPSFDEDFQKIYDQIYDVTGEHPFVYRFPGGSSNLVSAIPMTEFIKYLNEKNITYFDWNVSAQDAEGKLLTPEQIYNNVFKDVDKKDVCVVLMHDSASLPTTVEALSLIIEKLQEMDAVILPITETTALVQHIDYDTLQ